MIEHERYRDRVILVGIASDEEEQLTGSLKELGELAKTAGAEVVTRVRQAREHPDPATYVGSGKVEELKELLYTMDANGIICDDELTPAQMRNLQQALSCKVMDRTLLILDIFASRARTSEGKLQVELAQLRYRAAHLSGLGNILSRLGGGIGTRGPGEKKLEMDRRLIKERISALNKELDEVKRHRELIREGRQKSNLFVAAIVGYTNAGKSTLLNHLTDAEVLEEDALFATLDPTTRLLELPGGSQVLLTDTVGFIRKLPHHLIRAFRSTLEEATHADCIVHVADASNPKVELQMQVVYETLHELAADEKPVITLFNKQDLVNEEVHLRDLRADHTVQISAKHGENIGAFLAALEEVVLKRQVLLERVYPYTEAGKIALIRKRGQLLSEEYLPEGIRIKAYVPRDVYGQC